VAAALAISSRDQSRPVQGLDGAGETQRRSTSAL
jgi:hypothetical protein